MFSLPLSCVSALWLQPDSSHAGIVVSAFAINRWLVVGLTDSTLPSYIAPSPHREARKRRRGDDLRVQ
jgi:hypothetical protein